MALRHEHIVTHTEKAVWNTRKYNWHSVETDVQHFCGWPLLLKLVGYATTKAQKRLIAFLFETGGRISEVLELRTDMFHVVKDAKPPILIVRGMTLKKKYKKVGEFVECTQCHFESQRVQGLRKVWTGPINEREKKIQN